MTRLVGCAGKGGLMMRATGALIYTPSATAPSILNGTWTPPPVKRVP